jgi:hypothetical protein
VQISSLGEVLSGVSSQKGVARCREKTVVFYYHILAVDIPIFLRPFMRKITVSMGFLSQGVAKIDPILL